MRYALLLVSMLGLVWGRSLAAQEPARNPQGLGQLLVTDPQSGSPVRLNLAQYHVNVVLHPPVALVQIDQSFFNPFPAQQEGTFVFNLPPGASVSRFAMYTTPTELIEGELIDRTRAANIYQSIVNRKRDPAILEQIGGNLFRMRVFPIFAHDIKRILLDFTLPIAEQEDGLYTFELPLMSDLEPVWDFAIRGTIRGPNVAGSEACDSHPGVNFTAAADGSLSFQFVKQLYRPEAAFALRFRQRQSAEATVRSYTPSPLDARREAVVQSDKIKSELHTEFLATINPAVLGPIGKAPAARPAPADVLILADSSGGTVSQGRLRRAVRSAIGAFRDGDRFALGCVDVDFRPLTRGWVEPRSPAADQALSDYDREVFLGTTDLVRSLATALAWLPPAEGGRRRIVVYLGDGQLPAVGPTIGFVQQKIIDSLNAAGVHFSAVLHDGHPAGRNVLEKPVAATGGRLLRIDSAGSPEALTRWVGEGLADAVKITAVHAAGVDDDDLFAPPSWVPGRSLQIFGRRTGLGPLKLELLLERDGRPERHVWQLELKPGADDLFVGRLWAQHKLDQLRALEAARGRDVFGISSFEPRIVALSQEWTLLSPVTAFLVLENESEYPRYGIVRAARHVYWKPEDAVTAAPLPPEALAKLRQPPRSARVATREQLASALSAARRALADEAPRRALNLLGRVAESVPPHDAAEFQALRDAAAGQLARQNVLRDLGPLRGWFDRRQPIGFEVPVSQLVWQLLQGFGPAAASDDPRLAALGKTVTPPVGEPSIEDFADWVAAVSGLDVSIDRARVRDEGIRTDSRVSLQGVRSMSLENLLKHGLQPFQLTHLFEDGVLKLTTMQHAADKLSTRIYPVGDIIQTTTATDESLLAGARLDCELAAHRRLEENLDRKISVDFKHLELRDALDSLAEKLQDNMLVDRQQLVDEGIALDLPVTLRRQNAPLRQILAQILDQHDLAMSIESEALVITSRSRAADRLITRLHSAQGIVFELPPELIRKQPPGNRRNFWGMRDSMGGMSGMGGMAMGGMATGGGMGGMGGGMGFSGGGGGFVGGGMGGFMGGGGAMGGALPASTSAGVSEITADGPRSAPVPDDDSQVAQLPDAPRAAADDELEWNALTSLRQSPGGFSLPQPAPTSTAIAAINLISTTVQPDSWEDLSGPGSIIYYPGALCFAVRQTAAVHAETEELLERLRELPDLVGKTAGYRPAQLPSVGPHDLDRWDFNSLMNLIGIVVQPDSWEELSGPGSMVPHRPKLALVVRQTQAVHREIQDLLTALRRARHFAREGKSWKAFDIGRTPPESTVPGVTGLLPGMLSSELPEPQAGEIEALSVLLEPRPVTQVWRSTANRRPARDTVVRLGSNRSEFEFDGRRLRVAGDEAIVAYPGLRVAERGTWGEAVRRIVDGRLPWLPHRSKRDLARLFNVTVVATTADTVQLRMALPGAATPGEILVTVSRELELPIAWEARIDGHLLLRLRFENRAEYAGKPVWKTVVAEDQERRELERWELVDISNLKSDVPALEAGWDGDLVVDFRNQDRPHLPAAQRALQAIRNRNWSVAQGALLEALRLQPRQPLLLAARAWVLSQEPGRHRAEMVDALRSVARSGAADLLAAIGELPFAGVDDGTMYEILVEQPLDTRSLANIDHLVQFAARAGRPREAVELLRTTLVRSESARTPERVRRLVELLLATRQLEEAAATAESRAAESGATPDELAALAETLHQGGATGTAGRMLRVALAHATATGELRHRLLLKRASFESDQARWRTIVEAIDALPADSPLRVPATELLLGELRDGFQAEVAGQLVASAKDVRLRAALMLRQADLFVLRANAKQAAQIGWELSAQKQLPSDRLDWLFERLGAAGEYPRLARLAEDRLLAGSSLNQLQLTWLAAAYDALRRPDLALRARTNPQEVEAAPPKSPAPTRNWPATVGPGVFTVP